eukprot:8009702-Pyramimonas_sp.AAC.1
MAKPPETSPQNLAKGAECNTPTPFPLGVLKPANRPRHPPNLLRKRNMLEEKMAKPPETPPQNSANGAP